MIVSQVLYCHCTLFTIYCTLYIVHCTLYTVHCILYIVPYTLYTIHFTHAQHIVHSHSTVYTCIAHCTLA